MTNETKPHASGTCIYCKHRVFRAFPESPWKTGGGEWRCAQHPRALISRLTWHEAS